MFDQALAFVRRRLVEEGAGLGHGGNAPGQVEIDAPQKFGVVGQWRGFHFGRAPARGQVLVDSSCQCAGLRRA
jgi:hypothetical protein